MSDSIGNFNRYSSTRFNPKPDKKNLRILGDCELCGNAVVYFIGESLRLCPCCRKEYQSFQRWESKYGPFKKWKSVKEWKRRHL